MTHGLADDKLSSITQGFLRDVLEYYPEAGVFACKVREAAEERAFGEFARIP